MKKYIIFLILALITVTAFSTSTSPIYSGQEGSDSSIFKTMGLAVLEGKTPYVDIFDHKGPILYFIDALGLLILPGNWGIFVLQVLSLSIVFICIWKSARLFLPPPLSWVCLLLSIFLMALSMIGGNSCEEWELPAIAFSLYACLLFLRSDLDRRKCFFVGLSLGLAFSFCFFIRPNDAVALPGGMAFALFLFLLIQKLYKNLPSFLLAFLLGAVVIAIPVVVFFACREALDGLYYGLIGHNMMYAGGSYTPFGFKRMALLVFSAITSFLLFRAGQRRILLLVTPVLLFFTILVGGYFFVHYLTVLIPVLVVCFVVLASYDKFRLCGIYLLALVGMIFMSFSLKAPLHLRLHNHRQEECYHQSQIMISRIPAEERSQIWNYNLGFAIDHLSYVSLFCYNRIVPANRILLYDMALQNPALAEGENIAEKRPKWIMLTHADDSRQHPEMSNPVPMIDCFKKDYDYIASNYDQVACADTTVCSLEMWRRKDLTDDKE